MLATIRITIERPFKHITVYEGIHDLAYFDLPTLLQTHMPNPEDGRLVCVIEPEVTL